MIVLGILFIVFWILGHGVWISMSFVANAMANDSGAASADSQMALIGGMLGGQLLCTAAGIPAGLAFFMRGRRAKLWLGFTVLFLIGAAIQGWSLYSFFGSMSQA